MKHLLRLIPFKGTFYWEMQAGPLVLQMRHKDSPVRMPRTFNTFIDTHWKE